MTSSWRDTLQTGLGDTYRIREELGGGGMSSTFIAEEVALGRNVVLKVLSPDLASGLNVERFQREIHLAARLQHAFIVPLLSAGVTNGHPWYSMPLVQGESLRARIAREGALTPAATARMIRDVAEALAYAHAQGVVHRDIKPDNILLSGTHALVTDFGVAKAISASTNAGTMTGTGVAIGTAAYMAPEQAAGDPACDHRADLYALGATAYEMLTGRMLFPQRSPVQMLAAHALETPEPLAHLVPDMPRELAALVDQLLEKHPNDRPSRAQDVADVLSAMLTRWTSGELTPAVGQVTLLRGLSFWGITTVSATLAAWLAVRWLPVPEWTLPAVAIVMLAGLPVVLLTVWVHRPARPLAMVPSVASTTTVGRMEAVARPHLTWRRAKIGALMAVAGVVLAAGTWAGSRALGVGPAATLIQQGQVDSASRLFVADFDVPASDSSLTDVVTDLMRTELSRGIATPMVTAAQRNFALLAMGRDRNTRVSSTDAREVAIRANAKVYLAGSVTQLGSGYLLRATLHESTSGNELASFRQTASSPDAIIRAIDRMGREIRDQLGGTLRQVRGAPALYFALTPSLEAARLYTEGSRAADRGDALGGARLLQRAVEVDTQFAMAYRRLSSYYYNVGNMEGAAWAAERAFRYRDKLPPPLAALVEASFYMMPSGYDPARAISALERALEVFGRSAVALNNLGVVASRARDHEKALAAYREAIKTDTVSSFAPFNIASTMWKAGRWAEARTYVDSVLPRWFGRRGLVDLERAELAIAEMRPEQVIALLTSMRQPDSLPASRRAERHRMLAAAYAMQGRLALADAELRRTAAVAPQADTVGGVSLAALIRAELAVTQLGDRAAARRIVDSMLAARAPGNASALGFRWLDAAGALAISGDPALAASFIRRFEAQSTESNRRFFAQELYLARGWVAVEERRYDDAVTEFRRADVGECVVCALPPLAIAFDLGGRADSAIATYERYLATRAWFRGHADGRYLAHAYQRLGELYESRGEARKAHEHYARFVSLRANADPELQPGVAEVRRRMARLRVD